MKEGKTSGFVIPADMLSQEALNGLIESFILREGTDYGVKEFTLEEKNNQVRNQLKHGSVVIVYDPSEDSCSIVRKEEIPRS